MAESTGIEWADATWNCWQGCHRVSSGCARCYMFRDMQRYGKDPNIVKRSSKQTFEAPLRWMRNSKLQRDAKIFTCSWSDFFIQEADPWRTEAWEIIRKTPFTYLILTKRPERINICLPQDWGWGYKNVWLGVSAENQEMAKKRIPLLLGIPSVVRFVSAEPLLGPIDFRPYLGSYSVSVNWIITGGESDFVSPRPSDLSWFRSIRDQCVETQTAYFHKQFGGYSRIQGTWGGRELDGKVWSQFPEIKHVAVS